MRNKSFILTVMALFAMTAFFPSGMVDAGELLQRAQVLEVYVPQVSIDKQVDKTEAMPGDEITYTLTATNTSTATTTPLDVMLVLDDSGSMSAAVGCSDPSYFSEIDCTNNGGTWNTQTKMEAAKDAANSFVAQLATNDQSGVVSFNSSASLLQSLTFTHADSTTAINGISAGGGTNIASGVTAAHNEITANGRSYPTIPVMIVLSDGVGGNPTTAANAAKAAGIRIISIGLGSGVDATTMMNIATSTSDYYFAPDGSQLTAIYNSILDTLCYVKDLTITDDFTDVLVGADFVSSTPTATQLGNELTWEFADVGCGESVVAEFTVKVKDDAAHGLVLPNMARVIENHEVSLDSEIVNTTIYNLDPALLTIEKEVDTAKAMPGDTLNYTLLITNIGEESATDVVVTDVLPDGLTYEDGTTTKEWMFDVIFSGESESITYKAIVKNDATAKSYVNVASVSAAGIEKVEDDATTMIITNPSLTIDKTANVDFTNPGGTVTYTVVVTNNGDATAMDTVLIDHIPAGMQYTDTVAPTHTWLLGDIAPGDSITTTYDAIVSVEAEAGIYTNTAEVWAVGLENIFDTADVEVREVAVLGEELPTTGGGYMMLLIYMIGIGLTAVIGRNIYKLSINIE